MLEVGKLYLCEQYFLLLYPDWEAASHAESPPPTTTTAPATFGVAAATLGAAYWTRELGKSVSYTDKNIPLLVLNNKEKYVEVLAGDKKGWIIFDDYLNIKEIP